MNRYAVGVILMLVLSGAFAPSASAVSHGRNGVLLYEQPVRGQATDLFALRLLGQTARLLGTKAFESEAEWSHNGRKFVFRRQAGRGGPSEIYVANADGTGVRRLTRHRAFSTAPTWSPDGRRIVYASDAASRQRRERGRRGRLSLFVMNSNGSKHRRIKTREVGHATDPAWSPNGKFIAYTSIHAGRPFDAHIHVTDPQGKLVLSITRARGSDELNPDWSPEGGRIVYETSPAFKRRQSDLAITNMRGTDTRRLTQTEAFETNPVWAPDASAIAFTSDRDNRNVSTRRLSRGFELYTMDPAGHVITRLTANGAPDLFPDWQPLR